MEATTLYLYGLLGRVFVIEAHTCISFDIHSTLYNYFHKLCIVPSYVTWYVVIAQADTINTCAIGIRAPRTNSYIISLCKINLIGLHRANYTAILLKWPITSSMGTLHGGPENVEFGVYAMTDNSHLKSGESSSRSREIYLKIKRQCNKSLHNCYMCQLWLHHNCL